MEAREKTPAGPEGVYDKKVAVRARELSLRGGRRPTKQSQRSALRLLRFARNDTRAVATILSYTPQRGNGPRLGQPFGREGGVSQPGATPVPLTLSEVKHPARKGNRPGGRKWGQRKSPCDGSARYSVSVFFSFSLVEILACYFTGARPNCPWLVLFGLAAPYAVGAAV
jgi:hypothetical protein